MHLINLFGLVLLTIAIITEASPIPDNEAEAEGEPCNTDFDCPKVSIKPWFRALLTTSRADRLCSSNNAAARPLLLYMPRRAMSNRRLGIACRNAALIDGGGERGRVRSKAGTMEAEGRACR